MLTKYPQFSELGQNLQKKALALQNILKDYSAPFVIACSGGLDSRFLVYFAKLCNCDFSLIHIDGAHIDPKETAYLKEWSQKHQLPLTILPLDLFPLKQIAENHRDRCYHCKLHSFKAMLQLAQNTDKNTILCDGSHSDDSLAYRPGLRALQELGVQSPLALAKINKQDIRNLAKALHLDNHMQKARPCLLTRFSYNTQIDKNIIRIINTMESLLEQELNTVFRENIPDFRIRYIDKTLYFHYDRTIEEDILTALLHALEQTAKQKVSFKQLAKISGYFDSNPTNNN